VGGKDLLADRKGEFTEREGVSMRGKGHSYCLALRKKSQLAGRRSIFHQKGKAEVKKGIR